ncbi:bifunctional diguanylate cyclase/phosphodiesterase [Acidiphilium sp. 20-67-58]|uniref:putative bifunctional diguanylate cyclase/phosphodiesterase n=1 Tax=Acidiphilium sp. 20-67-58 TaxID=1970291 RepID=UPI0025C2CADD|nr:EAL domain-containing protein [Acidiphilium sp. 20-67-58]
MKALGHSLSDLPAQTRRQIEISLLDMRAALVPRMVVTGGTVAGILAWEFHDLLHSAPLIATGLAGLATCYVLLMIVATLWSRRAAEAQPALFKALFCGLALLIGVFWACIEIGGLRHATGQQASLVYAVIVGLISTAAFSGPALYALVYWAPVTAGAAIALVTNTAHPPVTSLIGLGSYALLTFTTILYVNANTMEREFRRLEAERQSEVINLLLRDFEEGASDFLWETDASLTLLRPSPRFAEAARTTQEALAGQSLVRFLVEHGQPSPEQSCAPSIGNLLYHIGRRETFNEKSAPLFFAGEERCWSFAGKPVFDRDGQFVGYRGVGSDVTAHRHAERRIAHIARHDSLTGLGNRMGFDEVLHGACASPVGAGTGLICLDLDHFKSVNDRFGHKAGDELLQAAAGRLLACVRSHDRCFRLGGDEFAILLPDATIADVEAVTRRIIDRLADPFRLADITVAIGCCAGIAMIARAGIQPEDVLHAADLALYRAKESGRGAVRMFDPENDRQTTRLRQLDASLVNEFERQSFFLQFQPIVRLESGAVTTIEALVRWQHPQYGILPPDQFIPASEHNGTIIRIGAYVIDAACAFAATLPEQIAVAINLSPVQLYDPLLLERIGNALARHKLGRGRIEFELTETAILDVSPTTRDILDAIRALGCRLALDDFGAGYSSISTLYYFPFDRLKIDRALIRDSLDDARRRSILLHVGRMAHDIDLTLTAEGLETEAHRTRLIELGFDEGQGALFSMPMDGEALHAWLRPHIVRTASGAA